MYNAVSALEGAIYAGSLEVSETGLRGMITLRGDLTSPKVIEAVASITKLAIPATGQIGLKGTRSVAWMSPDELLILGPYASAQKDADALGAALAKNHALVCNVSDARAVFRLKGAGWRDVLAKLAPADLSATGFKKGQIRRSRLAQAAAAFWISGKDQVDVVCFRSVAQYVFDALKISAHPDAKVDLLN